MLRLEKLLKEFTENNHRAGNDEMFSEKEETIKKLKESRLNSCERRKGKQLE